MNMTLFDVYQALMNEIYECSIFEEKQIENIQKIIESSIDTLEILITAGICITVILGLIILWNQRKIKKMLRDLQEQSRKNDDGSN